MTDPEIFNRIIDSLEMKVRDRAGLDADQEIFVKNIEMMFEKMVELMNVYSSTDHVVHVGFVADNDFNAFAISVGDVDVVAINVGVTYILLSVFTIVVFGYSDKYYDPSGQDITMESFGANGNMKADLKEDAASRKLVQLLFDISLSFIFFHELGHIWGGHTSYLNKYYNIRYIDELKVANSSGVENLDFQTLEMDADGFSIIRLMQIHNSDNLLPLDIPSLEERYGRKGAYIHLLVFAVYLAFCLFDEAIEEEEIEHRSHPPAPIRQGLILSKVLDFLQSHAGMSGDDAVELVGEAVIQADKTFSRLFGREYDPSRLRSAVNGPGANLVNDMVKNWERLRPELDLLKRGGILAHTATTFGEAP